MATEKIGTISNRLILDLLKNSLKAGSISQSEYDDLVKDFFPAPKLVQGDLFEDDNKKAEGGMMDINNMTRPLNFDVGGMAAEDEGKTFGRGEFSYDDPNLINFIQRRADQNDTSEANINRILSILAGIGGAGSKEESITIKPKLGLPPKRDK